MLKTALAILLIGLPCFAKKHEKPPIFQIIPLMPTGNGWFSTVTVTNPCKRAVTASMIAATTRGQPQWTGDVFVLAHGTWTHRFDGDPSTTAILWGELMEEPGSCRLNVTSEMNHLEGNQVKSLNRPAMVLTKDDISTGVFNNSKYGGAGDLIILNIMATPGTVSLCTQPLPDYSQCLAWKDYEIPPFTVQRLGGRGLQIYAKRSRGLIDSAVTYEAGQTGTYSADSSITFGAP